MTVPATGWYVEIDHPTSGYMFAPRVVDTDAVGPQRDPTVNERPRVRVPVPKDERWRDILDAANDASMRVWTDGTRQPIDTLAAVEETVAQGTAYTVLVGTGGSELSQRVEKTYEQKPVHEAAKDLIQNNTSYATNVDTPPTTTDTNETLLTIDTQSEWLARSLPFRDTEPAKLTSGSLEPKQTAFTTESGDMTRSGTAFVSDTKYSNDEAEQFDDNGDSLEFDFTLDYAIPAGEFAVYVRFDTGGINQTNEIRATLDGTEVGVILINSATSLKYRTLDNIQDPGRVGQGTHTFKLEQVATNDEAVNVDVVAPVDDRFSYTLDGQNDTSSSGERVDGPELFPDSFSVTLDPVAGVGRAITGGRVEVTANSTDGLGVALSNDQASTFDSTTLSSGTTAFETDFASPTYGPSLTLRFDLGRFGTRTGSTPETGFKGHSVDACTLKADLEDMPLIVNTTVDGHLSSILSDQLATAGDAIWNLSWNGSSPQLEWTEPGARTSDEDPGIAEYQASKDVGRVYQKAVVYGQADVPRTDVRFEASHGTAVSLPDDRLQADTVVVEAADTGERYRRGGDADYVVDAQAGTISTQSGGDIADGQTLTVDYRHQAFATYDDGTASPDIADTVEIPALRTDFACKQAARLIVNEVSTPLRTATATVPPDATDWSVVEALDPPIVPTDGTALHVRTVESTPRQTVLELGNRKTAADVVERISKQVNAVSRKA